ncbi:uncharacterized protein EDB91DRAFT_734337 [Suillus paluster]|uniref:uncharacterized protein n=1 Tax=Suillus paluster TaxID=48578 RepID=UPI001B86AD46|nr:uncharacterized protein EDB91DRAFT_734337 [Suillus paluster]KAG1731098.1 hypothetical protein EDB91DRAFT_734337 [Suillus paluster]
MVTSSIPTEQDWQSPASLPAYDSLPHRHYDFNSIMSNAKSTAETGTDFYDRGLTTRKYALAGVACSSIVSCCCITAGTVVMSTCGISGGVWLAGNATAVPSYLQSEMLVLTLNLIITLCTESIGFIHSISLRSALASESRLSFNTNLRLMTAARGWRDPNGTLLNALMAVLLIISYGSATLAASLFSIIGFPFLILGIALFLQVAIALAGMRSVKTLTWSYSPFDVTAALVHHTQLTPSSFRCMRGVSESDRDIIGGPAKPSEVQPSAWHAHSSIRKVVVFLWGLVLACAGWAVLIVYKHNQDEPWKSWSLLPDSSYDLYYFLGVQAQFADIKAISVQTWILAFVNIAAVQGPLTIGLHCSELIANVIQNERQWRCATTRNGLRTVTNPLKAFLANPLGLFLFVLKHVLHWMFGLSFSFAPGGMTHGNKIVIVQYTAIMNVYQIMNLCIALCIFACVFTLLALRRPCGPQPATYGHLQTLANLVDEWSPVMWWGHKEDGIPYCHAGTSSHLLPDVEMDCVYAGSGVVSHSPNQGEAPVLEKPHHRTRHSCRLPHR